MDCSTPGLPVHHQLPEFTQTHVHWVDDAIQSSHPLHPLLLLRSIFPSIRVFSSELALCFYLLAFVNNAVVNTGVQISHGDPAFRSFGHIPRSGIAGSDCNSMLIFRGNTMLFSLVAAPFTFPPRVHRHFNSTTSTPAFSLLCFSLIVAILMGVSW